MPDYEGCQRQERKLCQAVDKVCGLEGRTGWSVGDFWRWRYSDLMDDAVKGDFAEWLVGNLLGLPMPPGGYISGDNSDLRTPDGRTIEVKSSSFWQSWKLVKDQLALWQSRPCDEKRVRFSGLFGRAANGGTLSTDADFKSHLYIFAFQRERDPFKWDALDLQQWEFYALSRSTLREEKAKRDARYKGVVPPKFAISLLRLRELHGGHYMTATELQGRAQIILGME